MFTRKKTETPRQQAMKTIFGAAVALAIGVASAQAGSGFNGGAMNGGGLNGTCRLALADEAHCPERQK